MRVIPFNPLKIGDYIAEPVNIFTHKRRNAKRVQAVDRIARVSAGYDKRHARATNISEADLLVPLLRPMLLGDTVVIASSDVLTVSGQVVWSCGAACGLQLVQSLESDTLLKVLALQRRPVFARLLRLPVDTPARTINEDGDHVAEDRCLPGRDQRVMRIGGFSEGLYVRVIHRSGTERRGVVRWSHSGVVGLKLLDPPSAGGLGPAIGT
jgi:hypothetical protein